MRFADNFNPEWGYLAPAPSFMRTARVAFVAAVVGAASGAAVVVSLMDRPAATEMSIAARTLVQEPNEAVFAATRAAQLQAPHQIGGITDHAATPPASRVAAVAGSTLTEIPTARTASANDAALVAEVLPQKKVVRKQSLSRPRLTSRPLREEAFGNAGEQEFGARTPLALLPYGGYPGRGQDYSAVQAHEDF